MDGDWIKVRTSLPRDPRVVRISSALKADILRTIGGLVSAWSLFDEQTEDGKLDGYTPELLDDIVRFPGLSRAMEKAGWLVIGDGFLEIPRFSEHNGRSAKRRIQDNVRKMSAREADKCPHAKRTKSGPEKRREEYIERESAPPVDLPKAISYGSQIGMTKEQVENWWNLRTRDGWTIAGSNGITRPVQSWQHDLATAKGWRTGTNGNHSQQKPKPKTAAEYGI